MSALAKEESEWVFDFVMNLLKSPSWEVPIMSFIDDKCAMFDSEEENKFCYTEIHDQFRDIVDGVLSQNLAEIGITCEDFSEICELTRYSTDISLDGVHYILALDDFMTFKKIMVKRNMELELEAVRALKEHVEKNPFDIASMKASFIQTLKESVKRKRDDVDDLSDEEDGNYGAELDASLKAEMDASFLEIEILHKQEEIEQAELEQAIALSIALEEERFRMATLEAKACTSNEYESPHSETRQSGIAMSSCQVMPLPDMKKNVASMKKQAQETYHQNQQALQNHKIRKEDLHAQVAITEEELKKREKYMREQRDLIVAKKKKEREKQLAEHLKEQKESSLLEPPPQLINKLVEVREGVAEAKDNESEERRANLRIALARRMKQDLLESQGEKILKAQEQQFMGLDDKLRQVEVVRRENQKKEERMYQEITQTQNRRLRNIEKSLELGIYTEDDF